MSESTTLLGLDIGEKRIGIARANSIAKLPEPLQTLTNDAGFVDNLKELISEYQASQLIVGLPRGLDGQDTKQTQFVLDFADRLKKNLTLKIDFQDEALTSVKAKEYLNSSKKPYQKSDIDSVSAMFILDDYLKGM